LIDNVDFINELKAHSYKPNAYADNLGWRIPLKYEAKYGN